MGNCNWRRVTWGLWKKFKKTEILCMLEDKKNGRWGTRTKKIRECRETFRRDEELKISFKKTAMNSRYQRYSHGRGSQDLQ